MPSLRDIHIEFPEGITPKMDVRSRRVGLEAWGGKRA